MPKSDPTLSAPGNPSAEEPPPAWLASLQQLAARMAADKTVRSTPRAAA